MRPGSCKVGSPVHGRDRPSARPHPRRRPWTRQEAPTMSDSTPPRPRPAAWLTALLATAAALYLGYHLRIALDPDDTNHLETPLALAVAVQLRDGPSALYGPFS